MRIASFRQVSSKCGGALLHHTGAQYSAGANTSARAEVRTVEVLTPLPTVFLSVVLIGDCEL